MSDIPSLPDNYYKPLKPEPDAEDLALHARNCSPQLVTERLRQLVPLAEFAGLRFESIGAEETVLTAPLRPSAVNQNGTQQAAIFYLLADYALGAAMFGVLPGINIIGIHDRGKALPVQCWLKSGTVKHLAPGTGTLRAVVRISAESARALRKDLIEKGRGEMRHDVRIYQGDQLVALADHTVGMYPEVPHLPGTELNPFQTQTLKLSALMIAGLRDDHLSRSIAGEQGAAIAQRMAAVTPQLPTLVKGRSVSVSRHLESEGASPEQVVCLAAGLDTKPLQYSRADQIWFGVDLPEMVRERDRLLAASGATSDYYRSVDADLRVAGWAEKLTEVGFDPEKPTTVILEGLSMYLNASELVDLCTEAKQLIKHPDSRLWLDHVTDDLFQMTQPEVSAFLNSMSRLGEPFILGFKRAESVIGDEWHVVNCESAADVLGIDEPVHKEYRFSIVSLAS